MSASLRRAPRAAACLFAVVVVAPLAAAPPPKAPDQDWRTHGGDPGHRQYSPLRQITRDNVRTLQPAWTYHTGDASTEGRSQIQCQPIVVGSVLYATSPKLKVFALDAATGRERWVFDPFASGEGLNALGANRGLTYWESGADQRILVTAGQRLYALDAKTGKPIPSFGASGSVSLLDGLDRDVRGLYVLSNTPGAIYRDLLILGTRVSEGPGAAAPGHIRAYDVRTGAIRWVFHTIPHPGEFGHDTWPPDAWTRSGGANAWSGISVDEKRGLVFLPTGSAAFDFWGGNRQGANLFANCVLVLKADTGARVWHYQLVHHDIWDRDPPAAPVLLRVKRDGMLVDAVAQLTKSAHVFLFDRETGEPLFPIEERPYPASDVPGEVTWPTQPLPVKPPPFARQILTEDDVTDVSPEARQEALKRLRSVRSGGQFVPPSTQGTVIFPGFDGGAEWGGSAVDEETGLLYVNANEMPWILTLVPIRRRTGNSPAERGQVLYQQNCAACHGLEGKGDPQGQYPPVAGIDAKMTRDAIDRLIATGKGAMPSFAILNESQRSHLVAYLLGDKAGSHDGGGDPPDVSVPFTHTGYNRFLDAEGYPAVKPPWGTLNAIDLDKGEIVWKKVLGEFPELTKRGVPPTGTENYGGPIVTAGGLIFIGATRDKKFRAFDKTSGDLLWETTLPTSAFATPSTYSIGGKQFVVIAAGGGRGVGSSGDSYIAFALP